MRLSWVPNKGFEEEQKMVFRRLFHDTIRFFVGLVAFAAFIVFVVYGLNFNEAKSQVNFAASTSFRPKQCKAKADEGHKATLRNFFSESAIIQRTRNCTNYFGKIREFFPLESAAKIESEVIFDFPLAFAISIHEQVGIFEAFLASSFRISDSYCIHVDSKAESEVKEAVAGLVKCYKDRYKQSKRSKNGAIFTHPTPIVVHWGTFSVLEADLMCYREIVKRVRFI